MADFFNLTQDSYHRSSQQFIKPLSCPILSEYEDVMDEAFSILDLVSEDLQDAEMFSRQNLDTEKQHILQEKAKENSHNCNWNTGNQ